MIGVTTEEQIPQELRDTPVGDLLRFHNLGAPLPDVTHASLLVGTCMDNRIQLRLPPRWAFLLRSAGADLRAATFDIAAAVALRGVHAIAVVTHTDCAMAYAGKNRPAFVDGLVSTGWTRADAESLFETHAEERAIEDPVTFAFAEADRVRARFPGVLIVPLVYRVEDHRLYLAG